MGLYFYDAFLIDLRENGDANFSQRVLKKVLNTNGSFRSDAEDHRYDGIEDAWIRYVSGGRTAFRVVYIRRGEDVFLYRAGVHSVEDNLRPPRPRASIVEMEPGGMSGPRLVAVPAVSAPNRFLQNGRKRLLRTFLLGRRLIPHREVLLISPYLSMSLLLRSSRFGLALDNLIEDGTKVTLITRWPALSELDAYRDLDVRGVELLFHSSLHAKLYIFSVRSEDISRTDEFRDAAVIGSANLTDQGFGFDERAFNEELCYELPEADHQGALDFAYQLAGQAIDLPRVRQELTMRR